MTYSQIGGLPGPGTVRSQTYRTVRQSNRGVRYLEGGRIIDASASRDPSNTSYVYVLQPGLVMGMITASGAFAPSILGVTSESLDTAETVLDIPAAVATEIIRRIGATGNIKLTGPATAGGTVRSLTVAYSAVGASSITVTNPEVADVWTLTAPAGQDGGMYQLEVTTGKGTSSEVTKVTAALAANANSATVDAALEALSNVGTGGVAAVYSDPTLTLTFAANLGPVYVRVLADTTNDGGVFEGGWAAVHTTTGVDGRFVSGSFIQDTDGSETPLCLIDDGDGIRVVDLDFNDQDQQFAHALVGGSLVSENIINWPSDTALQAWLVSKLNNASGSQFIFDHTYKA